MFQRKDYEEWRNDGEFNMLANPKKEQRKGQSKIIINKTKKLMTYNKAT